MDVPNFGSVGYALDRLVKFINRDMRYQTLKAGSGGVAYGPRFIPRQAIAEVAVRSKPLAPGTRARQVVDVLCVSAAPLALAYVDTNVLNLTVLEWIRSALRWLGSWPDWVVALAVLVLLGLAWNTGFWQTIVIAAIAEIMLTGARPGSPAGLLKPSDFGPYDVLIKAAAQPFRDNWGLLVALAVFLYLDFTVDWRKVGFRAFWKWLRAPHLPPLVEDRSTPDLAIETTSGSVLWVALRETAPPEKVDLAVYAARVAQLVQEKISAPADSPNAVINVTRGEMYSDDRSIAHEHVETKERRSVEEIVRDHEALVNMNPNLVLKEITLLYHELERLPGYRPQRTHELLRAIEQYALGLRVERIMEKDPLWPGEKTRALKAARELASIRVDEPLLFRLRAMHQIDGELDHVDFYDRFMFLIFWVMGRLEEPVGAAEC